MKPVYVKMLSLAIILSTSISCSKSSSSTTPTTSCNITYTETGGLQADGPVQYAAGIAGSQGTHISTLSYTVDTGTVTLQNPATPWTKTINLKKGTTVSITAVAKVIQGDTLGVGALADGNPGATSCP